jgi:preprotein translocase subunit SecY
VLIMVGVALDTLANLESQVQQENYDQFFRRD